MPMYISSFCYFINYDNIIRIISYDSFQQEANPPKNQNRCPGYHIKPSLNRQIDTSNVSFYITKTNTIIGEGIFAEKERTVDDVPEILKFC